MLQLSGSGTRGRLRQKKVSQIIASFYKGCQPCEKLFELLAYKKVCNPCEENGIYSIQLGIFSQVVISETSAPVYLGIIVLNTIGDL